MRVPSGIGVRSLLIAPLAAWAARNAALTLPALLAVLLGAGPPPAAAEWLILQGGKKIETEGPWSLKGDLLTVHETTGRILTVAVTTVDAAACLKRNAGKLRIQASAAELPNGIMPRGRQIWPAPAPNPAVPGSAILSEAIAGNVAAAPGEASPTPSGAGSRSGTATRTGAAASGGAQAAAGTRAGAAAAAGQGTGGGPPQSAAPADDVKARKQARQAQMERDLRYHRIVEGCARMFIIDRAGFQRCVQAQWP
jgi:hypothetical protein